MVAARAANPASDVSIASELGSLVHAHKRISDPRWRFDAIVRVVPVFHRFGISTARTRVALREGARSAPCPAPLRERLARLLDDSLEIGSGAALARVVDALWSRGWRDALVSGIGAALALGEHETARALAGTAGRYLRPQLDALVRYGFLPRHGGARAWPTFVGELAVRCSEEGYEPSLPLVIAMVDAIARRGDRERVCDVERVVAALPRTERSIGAAHLARLDPTARAPSIRGAKLLLARAAIVRGELEHARELVDREDGVLFRQAGYLDLARATFEHGNVRDALRTLALVRDPRMVGERTLLHAEIHLTIRRTSETGTGPHGTALRTAWTAPTWTELEPRIDLATRAILCTATTFLRFSTRRNDQIIGDDARSRIRRAALDAAGHRELIRLFERAELDLPQALLDVGASDGLLATAIAIRAERVLAGGRLPRSMECGLRGDAIQVTTDPRSIERALYDEGLALSPMAGARRRVLIGAARACLRSAHRDPSSWSREVIDARLRTLVHLGGELGRDAIAKTLATLPPSREVTARAIETLCHFDADAAARITLARMIELETCGVNLAHVLQRIEAHRGLPCGFTALFTRIGRGAAWFVELLTCWKVRAGALPDENALRVLAERATFPDRPSDLVAELDGVEAMLRVDTHARIAARAADDRLLLAALLIARPARVEAHMRAWSVESWRQCLAYAGAPKAPTADPRAIRRLARLLGTPHEAALATGDLARLGVIPSTTFTTGGDVFRVRLLDKRIDLLTYLRFADVPARSCFRTDTRARMKDWRFDVWRDPLTFCFHIERQHHDAFRPCGFFFGGFATIGTRLAVVMNGPYVRPNSAEVREHVVRAIERAVCEPLGIHAIGIASWNGGYGPLPSNYVPLHEETLTRLRALARCGRPVIDAYDDISCIVNQRITLDDLSWRACPSRP